MSLLFSKQSAATAPEERGLGDTPNQLTPIRPINPSSGSVAVDHSTALRHSAVWACLRLRSNLISTMPLYSYRTSGDRTISIPDSPFISSPGGPDVPRHEWLQASQVDLDRCGNSFGVIRAFDAIGRPAMVELVPFTMVKLRIQGSVIKRVSFNGEKIDPKNLWHERQFVLPGAPIGLSPVMYSAMSIGAYLSAQKFALDWFATGAAPMGHLKNTEQDNLSNDVIEVAKQKFKAAAQQRDIFVSGSEWEFTPSVIDAAQTQFLEEMRYGVADIARFFDVPGDMIGAESGGSNVTYANVSQRNLQFLIMHLQPALARREFMLSATLAAPRKVRFDTAELLRLDPITLTQNLVSLISGRVITPNEARDILNRAPLTENQALEFDRLFPPKAGSGMAPAGSVPLTLPPLEGGI